MVPATNSRQVTVGFEAFDTAGGASDPVSTTFALTVGAVTHAWVTDTKVVGQDDGDPSTLADWDGATSPAPLTVGDPVNGWVDNGLYEGPALHFDGTNQAATTGSTALLDPAVSFSIATQLRNDGSATGSTQVAVAQESASGNAAWIGQTADGHAQFCVATAEHPDGTTSADCANSSESVVGDMFVSVVGSYNAHSGQLLLYVNGDLAGSAAHVSATVSGGQLVVGHGQVAGSAAFGWHGDVADTAIYDDALSDEQIADLQSCGLTTIDPNGPCVEPAE